MKTTILILLYPIIKSYINNLVAAKVTTDPKTHKTNPDFTDPSLTSDLLKKVMTQDGLVSPVFQEFLNTKFTRKDSNQIKIPSWLPQEKTSPDQNPLMAQIKQHIAKGNQSRQPNGATGPSEEEKQQFFSGQVTTSTSPTETEQATTSAQQSTNNINPNTKNKIPIEEDYQNILYRADKVFGTSKSLQTFKAQADKAYKNGDLSLIKYALDNFEELNNYQNNPVFGQKLDQLSKDPSFTQFTDLLLDLSSPFVQTTSFSGTPTYNNAIQTETETAPQTQTIVETNNKEELVIPPEPNFAGKIIRPESGDPDSRAITGLEDPTKVISQKTVDKINENYFTSISNPETTQKDLDTLHLAIETIESPPEIDTESPSGTTGEVPGINPIIQQPDNNSNSQLQEAQEEVQQTQGEVQEEIRKQFEAAAAIQ